MVWKIHFSLPVLTSKARIWPGDPGSVSGTVLPMMIMSSKITPGVLALTVIASTGRSNPFRKSMWPSSPNV